MIREMQCREMQQLEHLLRSKVCKSVVEPRLVWCRIGAAGRKDRDDVTRRPSAESFLSGLTHIIIVASPNLSTQRWIEILICRVWGLYFHHITKLTNTRQRRRWLTKVWRANANKQLACPLRVSFLLLFVCVVNDKTLQ